MAHKLGQKQNNITKPNWQEATSLLLGSLCNDGGFGNEYVKKARVFDWQSNNLQVANVQWKHDTSRPYCNHSCVQLNTAELLQCFLVRQHLRKIWWPSQSRYAPFVYRVYNPIQDEQKVLIEQQMA